jgi:hypothetical protein
MSYNGSGTFQINTSGQPVVTGTVISSSAFNALTADLATGLSTAITKDGQTTTTVRIPFAQGINSSLATDATSTSTGSIITTGGVGIAKALYVGTTANIAGTATVDTITSKAATAFTLQSAGTTAATVDTSQRLLVGATTSTYAGHELKYNAGNSGWAAAVINSKTDNATATNGFLVKYSALSPADSFQMFLCQDSGNTNRFFVQNNGATGGTSDEKLKKNIVTARDGYLEDLEKIRIVKYNWNEQPEGTPKELGWIAQEVEQVFPKMISTDTETGYKSVRHSVFVPMLIKAVQEQQTIITSLTARIVALEAK